MFYNNCGDVMDKIMLLMILIIFPILMYLVFSCYNSLVNKKIEKIAFIITILCSLYMSFLFNLGNDKLLLFCNIPILICYFKKEGLFGIILSILVVLVSYVKYDVNIIITILKYFSYFITYILLYKKKEFNYLFFKISAVIQGFFISFEYFMNNYEGIDKVIDLFLYIMVIYLLTFFCLYLFKLADNVSSLYSQVNKIQSENKLKNSLFKLTHEIKNPIAVCKGYLDMMDLNNQEKSKKYIGIIKSEIDRSLNVIADFMDYSKIKIKKEIFDMVMLMDEICDSFEILLKDKNIRFNYYNDYEELYVWGDYDRLKQVFINIIKNSIEAIEKNGIINVRVSLIGKQVKISISDNGIGMTEEQLQNVKEMFYTTKKNGTGLGVALSNEIIVAHNGSMEYESALDKGTNCIVTLPV